MDDVKILMHITNEIVRSDKKRLKGMLSKSAAGF